jgi:hypothetical protein
MCGRGNSLSVAFRQRLHTISNHSLQSDCHDANRVNSKDNKFCENCLERPATRRVCDDIETGKSMEICEECYEAMELAEELESNDDFDGSILSGQCSYCGQPAVGTCDGNLLSMFGVVEQPSFWCEQCQQDLAEFARRPENAVREDFPFGDEEALLQLSQQLADREKREEEFMKQRVAERKKKG